MKLKMLTSTLAYKRGTYQKYFKKGAQNLFVKPARKK
jgi:hypothetical protein